MPLPVLASTFGERRDLKSSAEFSSYCSHVGKRITKIKRDLKLTNIKRDRDFLSNVKSIDSSMYGENVKYGALLLSFAERDFVRGLQFNSDLELKASRGKDKQLKQKLHNSLKFLYKLITIAEKAEQDLSTKVELYAFYGIVKGFYLIKSRKFEDSGYVYSLARNALEFLDFHNSDNAVGDLYIEIIESFIDPSLKICLEQSKSHKSELNEFHDLSSISKKILSLFDSPDGKLDDVKALITSTESNFFDVNSNKAQRIDEIQWLEYNAKIYSKDVERKLIDLRTKESKISDSNISSFDSVLFGLQELIDTHENDNERVSNAGEIDEDESRDRQVVSTYLQYNLIFWKLRRDQALISGIETSHGSTAVEKRKEAIRVYDIMLDSTIVELKDLPGVYSVNGLAEDIDVLEKYLRAKKFFEIAQLYEALKKHREALLILSTIANELSNVPDLNNEFPHDFVSNAKIVQFRETLHGVKTQVHVLAQFDHESSKDHATLSSVADAANEIKYFNTINDLSQPNCVVNVNDILPVSYKPVFFDLAFNYIGESKDAVLESDKPSESATAAAAGSAEKKKGFFGLWR